VARDELKNLHVVNLWNTLWGEAKVFCESGGDAHSRPRYHLYAWILQKLSDMDQPETPELEALRAIILREFRCPQFEDMSDEEHEKLDDFREEAIRGAREPSAGRREDAESDTDEDTQPSYGDAGSNSEKEDQLMPEDRGLFGTDDPGSIETF
jgi:hypothetical protein